MSGYTFAFAGEPDLDRIIWLQPPPDIPMRSYSPPVGVRVTSAFRQEAGRNTPIEVLNGAEVQLLDSPMLQNRNWTLTLPGYEPIVPFHLRISAAQDPLWLARQAPLNPQDPTQPLWQTPQNLISAQGAAGLAYEPDTVGRATGTWNALQEVTERLAELERDLEELKRLHGSPVEIANLEGRIAELKIGIATPSDRRVFARYFVERFSFPMNGKAEVYGNQGRLGGRIDTTTPWVVSFWMGAWDPDVMCCYFEGSLQIPYAPTQPEEPAPSQEG